LKLPLRRMLVVVLLAMTAMASADKPSLFPGATRAAGHGHRDIVIRERHGNQVTSSNWSGYAVTTAKDSVSDVKGSWVVPAVTCNSTDAYAAFWVGIDGYGSSTVEQIGTDSDCVNGKPTYYAWFEFYPHFSYNIDSVAVKPGDVISAEVNYAANGRFAVSISVNGGPPFSTSTKLSQATRSSAEWIVEAVWGGGVLPLADFNTVSYSADNATVGKTSSPIGLIAGDVLAITMTADNGARKSQPSALASDHSSFTDLWYSAGP
jgi:Peptidase A4 family